VGVFANGTGFSGMGAFLSLLPPPNSLGERRHRGLAGRRVAVRRRAVFAHMGHFHARGCDYHGCRRLDRVFGAQGIL
jgi:hypothetical protein